MFKVYDRGDAVLIQREVLKWKEKQVWEHDDPDSIKITISKNSVIKVNGADMDKQGTHKGFYYYVWQTQLTDELGNYEVVVTTTFGSYSEKSKGVIKLK